MHRYSESVYAKKKNFKLPLAPVWCQGTIFTPANKNWKQN